MPPRSRLEYLPAELLSGILTRCSRENLVNLAQAHSRLRVVCNKELISYPLTMNITSDSVKYWVAYFRKENTPLTRGARSLDITIDVTTQALLNAVNNVTPTVLDVDAQPIRPNAGRILYLPSSLRKLSLKMDWMPDEEVSSKFLLLLLIRRLPRRCPHLEELSIQAHTEHRSDEFDKCIRRLTHLRKLHLRVWSLPIIPNRFSLLPASLTDLTLYMDSLQTQEDVATTVTWVRGIRKAAFEICAPHCTANVLTILSRGGATHLTELTLHRIRNELAPADPAYSATMRPFQRALTVGLQEFSLLQPPLHTLELAGPSGWSDSLHLPFLHTAVASTLTYLSLQDVDSCIFPSHLPWLRLKSLELSDVLKMGYQGSLIEPIFPVLTALIMFGVNEIQAQDDLFPALETIDWYSDTTTPEQMANLIRHDIKHIIMAVDYPDNGFEPLWEAMGGYTIDLIALKGCFPNWMDERADNGESIFPGFPNIREFTIE